uniref:Uncharacterized protein n=1 Tax=Rangifer tarandus platyrhynchus TaxID=3082113 RepID=A0ACB0ELT0_RANTA|nr:unnamed protein product [Rangifer tarandus platyrhynchus]
MKLGGLFLLASLLTLNTWLQAIGPCVHECRGDGDCGIAKECFQDGCRRVCLPAVTAGQQRPGFCPELPKGTVGICVERCSGDYSCPEGMKCCSNGCGHVCKAAVFNKIGSGGRAKVN